MDSESSPLKLPVLNFSVPDLKPGTLEWDSLKSEVRKALEEYGCFEALFNRVSEDLKQETVSALKELFDLPLETKKRNVSKTPLHGYLGPTSKAPLYESMGFEDCHILDKIDALTTMLWPEGNPNFSKTIQSYTEKLSELDQIVRRMAVESLGLEKYMDDHLNSTNYLLRVMKYKEPKTTEAKVGMLTHTDKNIVTVLSNNQVAGLEIRTKDGQWIASPSTPNSFVVIAGESLNAWTNGHLHSPDHRVCLTGYETRYSSGLFSVPKGGYLIKAPEEVIDEEYPLLYKPYDFTEFLNYYFNEDGEMDPFPLKTFCGV